MKPEKLIVEEIARKFPEVEFRLLINGVPEAKEIGIISTPVVALGKKIYSMGKPVIREKVEGWIRKELGS